MKNEEVTFETLPDAVKLDILTELIENLEQEVYRIEEACQHHMQYYEYGENEAAVEMSARLSEAESLCLSIRAEITERTQ
jgi:hypothetical protein